MRIVPQWKKCLAIWAVAIALSASAAYADEPPPLTNILQLTSDLANLPDRGEVTVRMGGTVLLGGVTGAIVAIDGSPELHVMKLKNRSPLERGQRVLLSGRCLREGTNIVLDAEPLIDNDGLHSMYEKSAGIWLEAGDQPIELRYFNQAGDRSLTVSMQGPGMPRQRIPSSLLFHWETNRVSNAVERKPGLAFKYIEGEWSAMPNFDAWPMVESGVVSNFDIFVSHRATNYGVEFQGRLAVASPGFYTFACASDDGSLLNIGDPILSVAPVGITDTNLPAMAHFMAGQFVADSPDVLGNDFCASLEGVATFASSDAGGLLIELFGGRGHAWVRVPYDGETPPDWLTGARIRVSGICAKAFTPEGYMVAGRLTAPSLEQLEVLDFPPRLWSSPIAPIHDIELALTSSTAPEMVHAAGVLKAKSDSGRWEFEDASGEILLEAADGSPPEPGLHAEVIGRASKSLTNFVIAGGVLRGLKAAATKDLSRGLPLLTTIEQVKQLGRKEAKLGYPVKVGGVITFLWPNGGFFLQDATWSIEVRMSPDLADAIPRIGDYWEVEGRTFVEFAPDIQATRARRAGLGVLPEPIHPAWGQLMDGSLDTEYVELQGIASWLGGRTISLLAREGRVAVQLPEMAEANLAHLEGALVRIRGCLIPGRDTATQQVKLGEFALRQASVTVDEMPPADPFAVPAKRASDLLLFESHVSPIRRVKLHGTFLQQWEGSCYLMDGSNGLRVLPKKPADLHRGDCVDIVGFPDLEGPSPVLREALFSRTATAPLPAPVQLAGTNLYQDRFDSTLVQVDATLVSYRAIESNQILEMRSGPRIWTARLPDDAGRLPKLQSGSELRLRGVYLANGGDRARGRPIDSFELLLGSASDVTVLHYPPWWTARHAVEVAGALLAVLILASMWIWALRREVDDRTMTLQDEIENHKRTESQLGEKTRMLTLEIEQRVHMQAEIERWHRQLLVTSRRAGMAEVATSVLHNVGNVLTSVNVLGTSIGDHVRDSKIGNVARLGELLDCNKDNLPHFFTADERGRKVAGFVRHLGSRLQQEQTRLLDMVKALNDSIEHINEIVATQQAYAKVSGVLETAAPVEVVEDALRMHGEALKRHDIEIVRNYGNTSSITMDRHKVLQILFNLLENAKHACVQAGGERRLAASIEQTSADFIRITVTDNGLGIPPENLVRIFDQGFSTRRNGHGFGLHNSILAAQDMGGGMSAHSEGVGKGATFILELPLNAKQSPAKSS